MKRGDVVRTQLPRPAGTPGTEQFGTRPAIIVQDRPNDARFSTVLIVPVTSKMAAARVPGTLVVTPSSTNGLSVQSVILTHQVRAIDRRRIEAVMGRLVDEDLARLEHELRKLLKL